MIGAASLIEFEPGNGHQMAVDLQGAVKIIVKLGTVYPDQNVALGARDAVPPGAANRFEGSQAVRSVSGRKQVPQGRTEGDHPVGSGPTRSVSRAEQRFRHRPAQFLLVVIRPYRVLKKVMLRACLDENAGLWRCHLIPSEFGAGG